MVRSDRFQGRVTRVRTYLPLGLISARSWVAPILLAAVGCAAEPAAEQAEEQHAALAVSSEFLSEERSEIDNAFRQWLDATGGSVDLAPAFGAPTAWTIEREPIERCGDTAHAAGCTRRREKRIELDAERIYPVELLERGFDLAEYGLFRTIALHELGHYLGLEHGDGALMNGVATEQPPCIDAETLANYCARRECAAFAPTC
jgi:hypothetical protein